MTSSVPLRAYHHHSSLGSNTDSDTIAPSNSKGSAQSFGDDIDLYDPYANAPPTQRKSWSRTPFEESATDGIHKPSLSYDTKDLGEPTPFQSLNDAPANVERPLLARWLDPGKYPLEQRIEDKKRGIGRQRYPVVVWTLTVIMVAVFIYELVVNAKAQGTPVSFHPAVNPTLGPSGSALIRVGARFPPCMKNVSQVPSTLNLPCLNDTANPPDRLCTIEDLCGHGGFHNEVPNQWWRFITPIFLHAGFLHIGLNMLAQLTASAQIEREMGSGGFFVLYFAAGIFGNVLGGNFALVGVPSVGASGAIFGTIAVTWVDLLAHWKILYKPGVRLFWLFVELILGVALGYIPYVDNFAHLGGFLMGLLVGTVFYPVISTTRRHRLIMWCFRIAAIPLAIILYVVLVRNFYTADPYAACSGCRYLSCIPRASNNHCKGTGITSVNGGSAI
jgi:membrane associated rhomboid family serine protease